jgi:hypothetical protein
VDPLFMIGDPQSWNGYTYANSSPVSGSDPAGTCMLEDGQKSCKGDPDDYRSPEEVVEPGCKRRDSCSSREGGDKVVVLPGGTTVTAFADTGLTAIDDFILPDYGPDAGLLGTAVDDQRAKQDFEWCGFDCDIDTLALIMAACSVNSSLCSEDFTAYALEQHALAICDMTCDGDFAALTGAAFIGPRAKYEPNKKHGAKRAGVGAEPTNPQAILDRSLNVPGRKGQQEGHRVGYDRTTGEIVVFRMDKPGIFHGYTVAWSELRANEKNALIKNGIFKANGRLGPNGKVS